jgi:hypothetical protein
MIHQDGSRHEWVSGQRWDLIVTMDDATRDHYDMRFVEEEGTASSFLGRRKVICGRGLPCTFYSDRGSPDWTTPEVGGQVGKAHPPVWPSHETTGDRDDRGLFAGGAGCSERAFATHPDRLPKELAMAGLRDLATTNRDQEEVYRPCFNAQFAVSAREEGSAFVAWIGGPLDDILCEQFERTVGHDNCVRFENLHLQILADRHRCHYVKAKVKVHRYADGTLALFHGPRKLACYTPEGKPIAELSRAA